MCFTGGEAGARSLVPRRLTLLSDRRVRFFVIITKHLRKFAHEEKRFILAFSSRVLIHDSLTPLFYICDKAAHGRRA